MQKGDAKNVVMTCGQVREDVRSVGRWRLRAKRFAADATSAAHFRKCGCRDVSSALPGCGVFVGPKLLEDGGFVARGLLRRQQSISTIDPCFRSGIAGEPLFSNQ